MIVLLNIWYLFFPRTWGHELVVWIFWSLAMFFSLSLLIHLRIACKVCRNESELYASKHRSHMISFVCVCVYVHVWERDVLLCFKLIFSISLSFPFFFLSLFFYTGDGEEQLQDSNWGRDWCCSLRAVSPKSSHHSWWIQGF